MATLRSTLSLIYMGQRVVSESTTSTRAAKRRTKIYGIGEEMLCSTFSRIVAAGWVLAQQIEERVNGDAGEQIDGVVQETVGRKRPHSVVFESHSQFGLTASI
jgi:hypothetical protein